MVIISRLTGESQTSDVPRWLSLRFGSREIPSTALRAGSSLRLKNGCVQDDSRKIGHATTSDPRFDVFLC